MVKVLVGDSVLKLSNGKPYYTSVVKKQEWDRPSYNPGDSLFTLVDRACELCRGRAVTLCIVSMGNDLEDVSSDIWLSTHRVRYWRKLVALRKLLDANHCSKVTLVFGGHGHWFGMDTVDFEYIIDDVLTMATSLGINAASGIERFLRRGAEVVATQLSISSTTEITISRTAKIRLLGWSRSLLSRLRRIRLPWLLATQHRPETPFL